MTPMHHVPDGLPDQIQHYIDGEFVDSVDGATFDVLDPVSNQTYVAGRRRPAGRHRPGRRRRQARVRRRAVAADASRASAPAS